MSVYLYQKMAKKCGKKCLIVGGGEGPYSPLQIPCSLSTPDSLAECGKRRLYGHGQTRSPCWQGFQFQEEELGRRVSNRHPGVQRHRRHDKLPAAEGLNAEPPHAVGLRWPLPKLRDRR